MFGRNKNSQPVDNQIPYEVYATAQQPLARRRRWLILLAIALVAVTLLIVGVLAIRRALTDDQPTSGTGDTTQNEPGQGGQSAGGDQPDTNGDELQPPQTLSQPPQQNAPLPNTGSGPEPEASPQSGTSNTTTVRKPE